MQPARVISAGDIRYLLNIMRCHIHESQLLSKIGPSPSAAAFVSHRAKESKDAARPTRDASSLSGTTARKRVAQHAAIIANNSLTCCRDLVSATINVCSRRRQL
jgi:hypothetical protein